MLKSLFQSITKQPEATPKYEFVERKLDEEFIQTATRITDGKYKGLIFSTGPVSFTEDKEQIKLNYQFRIEYLPGGMEVESDLDNLIGDIIMEVVASEVADTEVAEGESDTE